MKYIYHFSVAVDIFNQLQSSETVLATLTILHLLRYFPSKMVQITNLLKSLALLSLVLNVSAAPNKLELPRNDILTLDEIYRRDTPTHCVDDPLDSPSAGNLNCQDLGGIPPGKRLSLRDANGRLSCDECLGLNGNKPAVTENGVTECFITIDSSGDPGNRTSCPGDPAPGTVSTPKIWIGLGSRANLMNRIRMALRGKMLVRASWMLTVRLLAIRVSSDLLPLRRAMHIHSPKREITPSRKLKQEQIVSNDLCSV
jgi:hypothetical protein